MKKKTDEGILSEIENRLKRFAPNETEKSIAAKAHFDALWKGTMNAQAWEAEWDKALMKLEASGIMRSSNDILLAYYEKIGKQKAIEIRKDRREREDGTGARTVRVPRSWEEAHEVLVEMESIEAGTRSIHGQGWQGQGSQSTWQGQWQPDAKGKGQGAGKGKGKGKT